VQDLAGQKPHFTRAIAASRSELGLSGSKRTLEMKTVDDQACAVASLIAFEMDRSERFGSRPRLERSWPCWKRRRGVTQHWSHEITPTSVRPTMSNC
jgi:hypothetical protein